VFNFIIYFVVAVIVYMIAPGDRPPRMGWAEAALGWAAVYAVFTLVCRLAFVRLRRRLNRAAGRGGEADGPREFYRVSLYLSVGAIVAFGVLAHGLELRAFVGQVPGVGGLSSWQGLVGLTGFISLLMIVWYLAWPTQRQVFGEGVSRRGYVVGQLRLAGPIMVPWLVLSAVYDLLEALPWPWLHRFINNPAGVLTLFGLGVLAAAYFFPVLVRYVWGLKPMPDGPMRDLVRGAAVRLGFEPAQIFLWPLMDGRGLSAGVLGFFRRTRYLLVSPALLNALPAGELEAVVAHEAGHVRYRHVRFFLVILLGYGLATAVLLEVLLPLAAVAEVMIGLEPARQTLSEAAMTVLVGLPLVGFMVLYFRYLMGWFMRHFERQADAFALTAQGEGGPIAASLERLAVLSGRIRNLPSWHHFSIARRVDFIDRAWRDPDQIERHDRLVRRGQIGFILALVLLAGAAFQLSLGPWGDGLRRWATEVRLEWFETRDPGATARALSDLIGDAYWPARVWPAPPGGGPSPPRHPTPPRPGSSRGGP
jgi:Zn-dependent protease with chaperone function